MQSVERRSMRRKDDVSTTFPDASNTNVRLSPEASVVGGKRTSKALKLMILTTGLLLTFAWIGFLGWAVGKIVTGW
jgi:hypothetical protein